MPFQDTGSLHINDMGVKLILQFHFTVDGVSFATVWFFNFTIFEIFGLKHV